MVGGGSDPLVDCNSFLAQTFDSRRLCLSRLPNPHRPVGQPHPDGHSDGGSNTAHRQERHANQRMAQITPPGDRRAEAHEQTTGGQPKSALR